MNTGGIIEYINSVSLRPVRLMEVCGTHTHSIARAGIKSQLPANIKLISGPGCPVCVTPAETIDAFLGLSSDRNVIITTYGDMLRVPGSEPGDSLYTRKALGADVRIVYSPTDAVDLAMQNPLKEVVFLGVGFETTAPGTAAAIEYAIDNKAENFHVFSMLKRVEPSLRTLIEDPGFNIDGFIVPGHVAAVIGEDGFSFLPDDYGLPGVVTGFSPDDIWRGLYMLIDMLTHKKPCIKNAYKGVVHKNGNPIAKEFIDKYFSVRDDEWRGLGHIKNSGFAIKGEYSLYDAEKFFNLKPHKPATSSPCLCGEIIKGKAEPEDCPLFGRVCVPDDPVGPCMVSGEGACSAAYKYKRII